MSPRAEERRSAADFRAGLSGGLLSLPFGQDQQEPLAEVRNRRDEREDEERENKERD